MPHPCKRALQSLAFPLLSILLFPGELWSFGLESEPVPTETRPAIEDVRVSSYMTTAGTPTSVSVAFIDPDPGQSHTVIWEWGDGTTTSEEMPPGEPGYGSTGAFHAYAEPGFYTVKVRVIDDTGRSDSETLDPIVVYDPDGPSAAGAGWIALPQGKGTFHVDASYRKNEDVPEGRVRFQAPGIDLRSRSFILLVVSGPTAWLVGYGDLNGEAGASFWIAMTDGDAPGGGGIDRFRIRIWDGEEVVFDNEPGTPLVAPPATALGGGAIRLHQKGR